DAAIHDIDADALMQLGLALFPAVVEAGLDVAVAPALLGPVALAHGEAPAGSAADRGHDAAIERDAGERQAEDGQGDGRQGTRSAHEFSLRQGTGDAGINANC